MDTTFRGVWRSGRSILHFDRMMTIFNRIPINPSRHVFDAQTELDRQI